MYEALYQYITARVRIDDAGLATVREAFTPRTLHKREFLLQEGQICRYTAFVVKGVLRQYFVDDKGSEHITQFAIEDWWISDRESLANQTPSKFNIDALEDSDLLLITRGDMQHLEMQVPAFKELLATIKERRAFAGQQRVISALAYSAEEKYREFVETYPEIVQRVPQHMIAAYLGITPETLSRLRSKSLKG